MSLPIGTLVLFLDPDPCSAGLNGAVGEVTKHYGGINDYYCVRLARSPQGRTRDWACPRKSLYPITPPGQTKDVTQDEPIKEIA